MSNDMKTVTHNGKEYQIGALYQFSNDNDNWFSDSLVGLNNMVGYPFEGTTTYFKYIREIENPVIGTIKDAPVELEDGCSYKFHHHSISGVFICLGTYNSTEDAFLSGLVTLNRSDCTNIVKLVPEVK